MASGVPLSLLSQRLFPTLLHALLSTQLPPSSSCNRPDTTSARGVRPCIFLPAICHVLYYFSFFGSLFFFFLPLSAAHYLLYLLLSRPSLNLRVGFLCISSSLWKQLLPLYAFAFSLSCLVLLSHQNSFEFPEALFVFLVPPLSTLTFSSISHQRALGS